MALPARRYETLEAAVQACLEMDCTIQDAAKFLEQYVRADTRLRNELTEKALPRLCLDALQDYNRAKVTRPAWEAGLRSPASTRASTAFANRPSPSEQAKINARRAIEHSDHLLSNVRLLGKVRLCEATYDDVVKAASFYGQQGRNMLQKERWMHAIIRVMDRSKKVGDTLDEARLRQLQNDTLEVA